MGSPQSSNAPAPQASAAPSVSSAPVLITGANSGVGFEATRLLVEAGIPVVMVCRSADRGEAARTELGTGAALTRVEQCDLADLGQVRALATRLVATGVEARALVNNAGLYRARLEHTVDGYERTLAVNHLGHYLLTRLLEQPLRRRGARIVNVTSGGHRGGRLDRRPLLEIFRGPDDYGGWQAYADSKQANVLFTLELARRWPETPVYAVHPGVLATAIWDRERTLAMQMIRWFKPFMGSPAEGGRAVTHAVLDADDPSGTYFRGTSSEAPASGSRNPGLGHHLWEVSGHAVGPIPR
jgi:retinol dehydrogenase 13